LTEQDAKTTYALLIKEAHGAPEARFPPYYQGT